MGFPGTQWEAGCEQRKYFSNCASVIGSNRLDPACKAAVGHVPVSKSLFWREYLGAKDGERMEIDHLSRREG
jgi:hypothetical protein